MAKKQDLLLEELLEKALVPECEWPFKVPENWEWVRLEILCSKITDGEHIKPKLTDHGVPLLTAKNILDEEIDFTNVDYVDENIAQKSWARCEPKLNDILVCSRGTIGRNTIINVSTSFCLMGTVILLRFNNLVCSKFYNYVLKSDFMQNKMKNMCGSTAVSALYLRDIKKLIIPLPPLDEQLRIVDRIESLFEKLNQVKGLIQDALDSFENRKAVILHKAFTGELTKKWRKENGVGLESWEEKTFEACTVLMQNGISKRKGENGIQTIVLRLANINGNDIVEGDLRTIDLDEKEIEKYSIDFDDALIVRVNGSVDNVGKFIRIANDKHWTFCDHLIRVKFDLAKVYSQFMIYFSMTEQYKRFIQANMVSSAGQNTISQKSIGSMIVSIPSLQEQNEIVQILDQFFEKEQEAKNLYDRVDKIDLIKKSILARAFRGKLGTNDESEESAAELLKEVLVQKDQRTIFYRK